MSSKIDTANLEAKDLKMLKKVLVSCGFRGDILGSLTGERNIAAELVLRLFRQGLREPAQLADALHRNFDKPGSEPNVIHFSGLHRYAVQGVTPLRGRRVHLTPPSTDGDSVVEDG
jgi:hypothetical protein